jgi:hypothetical protein
MHGYPDLAVWTQGGGVYPGYYARVRFNGERYPIDSRPVFEPKLKGKVSGRLLIDSNKPGAPLYP